MDPARGGQRSTTASRLEWSFPRRRSTPSRPTSISQKVATIQLSHCPLRHDGTHPPNPPADLAIAPEDIIVAGDSAGGGLCLTLMQYLRDAGLPQVGAAYLLSPWCDLTTSFESWNRNVRGSGSFSL